MVAFAMLLAGTNLVINVADAIPRFDVSKTCKAAIDLSGNSGRTVEGCLAGEDKAARRSRRTGPHSLQRSATSAFKPRPRAVRQAMSRSLFAWK